MKEKQKLEFNSRKVLPHYFRNPAHHAMSLLFVYEKQNKHK